MALCGCTGNNGKKENYAAPIFDIKPGGGTENRPEFSIDSTGLKFPLMNVNPERLLTAGTYEMNGLTEYSGNEPFSRRDFKKEIEYKGQKKLVKFKSFTIDKPHKELDGVPVAKFRTQFQIVENPLPIALIGWSVLGISGLTAGGYFVNSVNKFTGSATGIILSAAAAGIGLITLLRK